MGKYSKYNIKILFGICTAVFLAILIIVGRLAWSIGIIGSRVYLPPNQRFQQFYTSNGIITDYYKSIETETYIPSEEAHPIIFKIEKQLELGSYRETNYALRVDTVFFKEDEQYLDCMISLNGYPGTPAKQYYRLPRLSPGDLYLTIVEPYQLKKQKITFKNYFFRVQLIDEELYLYPINFKYYDNWGESEPFVYLEEAKIYKQKNDYDVINYLEKFGIENPEYAYKISLEKFLKIYPRILQWGFYN